MSSSALVLYVEDESTSAIRVKALLEKEGYRVMLAADKASGLQALEKERPDLCLLDLTLPDGSGLDLLGNLATRWPGVPAIMLTSSDAVEDVLSAMKAGASDYVVKPVETARLLVSIRNSLRASDQQEQIERLQSDVESAYATDHLVGTSHAMDKLRTLIRKTATIDASVLIVGENGTGKELVARALHFGGPRRRGPFIEVNSAALTDALLQSELFGHEKGAFTGADTTRQGKFEQADKGSLLLDEIGDMPPATQATILRALEARAFQRVGGAEQIRVDVRVLCATNRNLEEAVKEGSFRQDLLYRINTIVIEVPPLRDHPTDIPELARHFLVQTCRQQKREIHGFSGTAMETLCHHAWPGNVRELRNAVDRAAVVCDAAEILPEHLPPAVVQSRSENTRAKVKDGLVAAVEQLERSLILPALEEAGGVKSKAARALGITERMISYKMQNLGISRPKR